MILDTSNLTIKEAVKACEKIIKDKLLKDGKKDLLRQEIFIKELGDVE